MKQGDIYMADLNPIKGHEQGGYRPVLVLQNNILNKNLNTVIIAPLTRQTKAKGLFTTHFLPKKITKLPEDSIALLFQVRTIDASRLQKKVSELPTSILEEIKKQFMMCF